MHSWYATQSGPVRHIDMQFERKCRMSYGVHVSSCSYHFSLTPARSSWSSPSSLACDRKCAEEEEEEEENGDDDEEEEEEEKEEEEAGETAGACRGLG